MGVRFIKADVEGNEREVLDGARITIARDRPIISLELIVRVPRGPCRRYSGDSARALATTPSSSNAAKRSQRCPRLLPSRQEYKLGNRDRVAERIILAAMRGNHRVERPQVPQDASNLLYGRPAFCRC